MKKIIIILIILLFGALTLFLYSAINERASAPSVGEITTGKMTWGVSAKSPSGFKEEPLSHKKESNEIVTDKEGMEKTAEETIFKEETGIKVKHNLEAVPAREEIKEKGEKPAALVPAETPALIMKDEEKAAMIGDGIKQPVKKMEAAAEEPRIVEEKKETIPVALIIMSKKTPTSATKELSSMRTKGENKAAMIGDGIKQPVKKMETAVEEPRIVEEKKETMPAALIIMSKKTPTSAIKELSSMRTKGIIPGRENEQPLVKMEAAVTGSRPEKAIETKTVIPAAGKKEEYMEKPEHFTSEMLKKESNKRVAIFPFENFTDNKDAIKHVLPLLIDKLEEKGFDAVDEDKLNSFLCNERVRSAGYISRELAEKIRKKFNVSIILTGTVISFSTGEVPEFGILARLIDSSDGTILWADYFAATGEDFLAILDLGRLKTIFSLIPKVIDILFASFKVEELYREIMPTHRIAVMPFKNNTNFNNAGILATNMFIVELLKSREFVPIEYGDIRDIIVKLGIRRKGDIDYGNIDAVSKALKVRGILVGVVDNYSDGVAASVAPNVGITARLIDSSNNNILWYNSSQLSGEEDIIVLDWGRIRSVHAVAYKAVSSLVKEMSKNKWSE